MKHRYSLIACILAMLFMLQFRVVNSDLVEKKALKVTTWDAFGYYMYLPSIFIYHDVKKLEWLPAIEAEYELTGGYLYQSNKCDNGNYVNKYLGGVAIMQLPFFGIGHLIAISSNYKADGFSPPYQYAMAFGSLIYCILALFLLRFLLLKFFTDWVTALSILLMVGATNMVQYTSVDGAMSHAYIFPLYVLIIYASIKWHNKPSVVWAAAIGIIMGVAAISRPTEAIMFLIPLLWNTHNKAARKIKWQQVRDFKSHMIYVALFGLIGVLPQLIYWKVVSGSFVYDVGSKWMFLNPYFRVLFGWHAGWFIYTPITILFVLGLFFGKSYPFKNSMIAFCLVNIWVIIAWSDWRYGGQYSARALVQSYPVFIFPFAAVVQRITQSKWHWFFYPIASFLLFVNVFQLHQYNNFILHYRDMNFNYYSRIYLNPNPTTLDMSLLDTDEVLWDEDAFEHQTIWKMDSTTSLNRDTLVAVAEVSLQQGSWVKIKTNLKVDKAFYSSYLNCLISAGDSVKQKDFRVFSPLSRPDKMNAYEFFIKVPDWARNAKLNFNVSSNDYIDVDLGLTEITLLTNKAQ